MVVCRPPTSRNGRWHRVTALVLWCLGQTGVSLAQPSEADVRAARDFFSNAVKEEDNNHWQAALTMFKQVSEVKLTAGVRYHLALCEEKLGDLAKALSQYTLAESQARQENARDVLRLVGKQVERLEQRVPRLTVQIVPNTSDALITLDGAPLGRDALDHPYPVDPGTHEIKAVSPGRIAAKGIVVMRESDMSELELKLEPTREMTETQPVGSVDPNAFRSSSTAAMSSDNPPTSRDRTAAMLATTAAIALTAGGAAAFMMADRALDEGRTCVRCRPVYQLGRVRFSAFCCPGLGRDGSRCVDWRDRRRYARGRSMDLVGASHSIKHEDQPFCRSNLNPGAGAFPEVRTSPSISVAFLVTAIGAAGAACVDLFHSTVDLRTECEMTPDASGCRGTVDDATVASSSGICRTREIARALANQACAWLGACEGPIGRNAFGSCVVQARLAFDCAANPSHPIKGHEADLWMCLANVQSCAEASACILPNGAASCSEIGSSCRGSPDGGPTGDVRFECSRAYTLDGGEDAVDGQPVWVSYAEDCALFGQTCSMDGDAAVCAGSGGATGCASESCPGGASTNLIRCPNSADQGLDCASNGAQRCGGFPKSDPTWLACVPEVATRPHALRASASPATVDTR